MTAVIDIDSAKAPNRKRLREPNGHLPPGGRDYDDRPLIRVSTEIHEVADRAIEVLAGDLDVYQRDGDLVRVTRTAESEADAMTLAGTPTVRRMANATLRETLTRVSRWEKYDRRSESFVPSMPPDPVVHAVAARGEFRGIRPIVGVAEAPMLRPDGSVLETPGYDAPTGYLYIPGADFPSVPEQPTQEDARRAFAELAEVFVDFPFCTESDRVVPVAAALTLLARPAIAGSVPAFLFDANTRGSGKTLQADVVSIIATGRGTAKMTYPPDDVELEKVLAGYALRSAALIAFDNVTGRFGGGPLDRVLTAGDSVELRVLGKSEIPSLRWRAVIVATGNNIEICGDTSRRVLLGRIESPLERPEDREDFRHPELLPWVQEQRPRLVVAALTILRAWIVAGRPLCDCKTWGSFEQWSALIPPALVYAGAPNPMACRLSNDAEDPERRALLAIIAGLPRLDPGGGLTAKAAITALYTSRQDDDPPDGFEELREAIEELVPTLPGKPPSPSRLGCQLRKFRRRVIGGQMIDVAPGGHAGSKKWLVVRRGGQS
jgi:hypothetical protein